MTRDELERRLHAAVSALAALERDDGVQCGVAHLALHGIDELVDIVAGLPGATVNTRETLDHRGRLETYRLAQVNIFGVDVDVYGNHQFASEAETEAPPASESAPAMIGCGVLGAEPDKGAV